MKKITFGLKIKFVLGITLLCVIITFAVSLSGINIYKNTIIQRYNKTAYQAAMAVSEYFTDEELEYYADLAYRYNTGEAEDGEVEAARNDERYIQVSELIEVLRKNMDANDINICTFNMDVLENFDQEAYDNYEWNPLYYIVDCYNEPEKNMYLGESGSIYLEFCEDIITSYYTGVHSNNFFVAEGSFGHTTSAVYPIVRGGKVVAFSAVEIPMSTLRDDTNYFIMSIVVSAAVTAAVILLIGIVLIVKTMITPIKTVTAEAEKFVSNNNVISEKLKTIKTGDEIQTLSENILKLETDINEYIDNLTKVTAEKERIGAELNVAAHIQANMLPSIFPAFPDREEFDIYATMLPAKEVGGDFYDFFMVDGDHLALVMADVSGKGVPAALFMVIAKTLIKNRTQMSEKKDGKYSPSEILSHVNEQLCEGNEAELFVTVFLCIIELSTGKCVASNAGHEYPAIRRAGGKFEVQHTKNSPAVATMEGMRFREFEFELSQGDTLYTYTDGVAEATDANNELFGLERMIDALNENPDAPVTELLGTVKERLDGFVGEAPQFDDITMLGLKYYGKDASGK